MRRNILPLNASTLNSLKLKHPEAKEAASEVLLDDIVSSIHPFKFEEISGESVRKAAIRTKGGSGPSGQDAGCEALIHAMKSIYDEKETEAVLLVGACNAFNAVNRKVFLHNIRVICPPLALFVTNCYSVPSRLFVIGGVEIKSSEGTAQGDSVSMAIYTIASSQ
eukprot:gene17217-biopygen14819